MPPLEFREWWLAAAAATSILTMPAQAVPSVGDRVGVATAARPTTRSVGGDRIIYAGNDIAFGEQLRTDDSGALHILFMDQSSITVGPNSAITIDQYVYHPESKDGGMRVTLLKGLVRVVGGALSKYSDTHITTNNSTIGIRGGITIVETDEDLTQGIFLFGEHMLVTTLDGKMEEKVIRPGYSLTIDSDGLGKPKHIPVEVFASLLGRFESRFSSISTGEVFTPEGKLISTEDRLEGADSPQNSLATDRLGTALENVNSIDPEANVRNVLGTAGYTIQS